MGRKGLGKLSLFSIANHIEIQTVHDGHAHGCTMQTTAIRLAAESGHSYHPTPILAQDVAIQEGTQIRLSEVRRERLATSAAALRKRLALRFSIIGESHDFNVSIDGEPITIADRDNLSRSQFLWTLGESRLEPSALQHIDHISALKARDEGWDSSWEVRGWIGTAHKPKDLDIHNVGNLNSIVVLARGRLIHENILEKLNDGRLYTKYLTGQIQADFLDLDDAEDMATSDRQRVQEHDFRYTQLVTLLRDTLREIERRWNELRPSRELKKAREESPALEQWLEGLGATYRPSAEQLIGKLRALPIDDAEQRRILYRHGILAFERLKVVGLSSELADSVNESESLLRILGDSDALEGALYVDIVRSRLQVLKVLLGLVDDNVKERVLQEYLFDHLWLLDPAWERATGSELMEHRIRTDNTFGDDDEEAGELYGRVDIMYRTTAGKHIIVELKRAGRNVPLLELTRQGQKYVDGLRSILLKLDEPNQNIEVVFVLGKPLPEEKSNPARLQHQMESISPGSRVTHYDALIYRAEKSYLEFIEKNAEFDRVTQIVEKI